MNNNLGLVTLAIAIVAGAWLMSGSQTATAPAEAPLGAFAGPDIFQHATFFSAFSAGGAMTIATSASAMTLTDAQMRDNTVFSISQSSTTATFDPALALTLPASTTWSSLPLNGVSQSWIFDNLQTAAATTTTITAGTGVDIDGTGANDDVLNGGVSGKLVCWRTPTTDIRCIVEEMVDAG